MDNIETINPSELAERLRLAWEKWAILNGEAMVAKKEADRVHAQLMIDCGNIPVSKALIEADASVKYADAVSYYINVETEANKAKGLRESLAVYIDLIRSFESSRREELKRLGR
jgi:hypothetical protein